MERPAVYSILRCHLIERLTELYKIDNVAVAKVCDEALDRSGALLGEVRTLHRKVMSHQHTTAAALRKNKMSKIHYGWEESYYESNEPSYWGTACGLDSFEKFTSDWNKVTCKRCLKRMPQKNKESSEQQATRKWCHARL